VTDLSLSIDLLINGPGKIAAIRREIESLQKSANKGPSSDGARKAKEAGDAEEKAARSTLAHAQALARLQAANGDTAGAVATLAKALDTVNQKTLAAVRAQTQLAGLRNQLAANATAGAKNERALLQQAQAAARLQQAQGNVAGAANTLQGALGRVTQGTLAATRAQIQLTNLQNNYANSPLIGAVRQISQSITNLVPGLGKVQNVVGNVLNSVNRLGSSFSGLSSGAGQASASIGDIGAAAGASDLLVAGLGAAVAALVIGIAAVVAAGAGFVALLKNIGERGIEANAQLEQTRIGIASVIASVASIKDNKGIELKGLDALNATIPIADNLLKQLRVRALETSLSFEELSQGLLQALGPGLQAGIKPDKILDFVVSMSQLVGPLTGHVEQLGQEIRALFSGNISPRSAQVASALGITSKDIKAAKEAGQLTEFLDQKLKVAAATGKLLGQTFTAAKTNLAEALNIFSATVTEGLFNTLRDKINQVLPELFDAKSANLLSKNLSAVGDTLTAIFNSAGSLLSDLIDAGLSALKQINTFLDNNRETVAVIIQTVEEIFRAVGGLLADILGLSGGTQTWSDRLKLVSSILQFVLTYVERLRLLVGIVGNGFVIVGATIVKAVLLPLGLVAKGIAALTEGIPVIGDQFKGAAQFIDQLLATATSASNDATKNLAESLSRVGKASEEAGKRIENARKNALKPPPASKKTNPFPGASVTANPKDDQKKQKQATANQLLAIDKKLREAELIEQRARTEQRLAIARAADEAETASLERALSDRTISLNQYYDQRRALTEAATSRELNSLREQLSIEKQALADIQKAVADASKRAKNDKERDQVKAEGKIEEARQLAKVLDLEGKIAETGIKGGQQLADLDHQRIEALKQLSDELANVQAELLEATGRGLDAAAIRISLQFREILKKAIAEFGADSGIVLAIKQAEAAALLQAQIADAGEKSSAKAAELDLERTKIQNDLNAGVISERQAKQEILNLERQRVDALIQAKQKEIDLAEALLGPDNARVIQLKKEQEELKKLGVDGETAFLRIKKSAEEGLTDTLTNLFNGTKGLKEAFLDLFKTVQNTISRIAAEEITDAIFKRQPRNAPTGPNAPRTGLGGILDKILGRNKQQTDQTAAAVGKTTNAVTAHQNSTQPRLDQIIALLQQMRDKIQQESGQGSDAFEIAGVSGILGALAGSATKTKSTSEAPKVLDEDGNPVGGGDIGGDIADKITGGLKSVFSGVFSTFKSIFGGLTSSLGSLFGGLTGALGSIFGSIGGAIGGAAGGIGSFLSTALGFLGLAGGGSVYGPGDGTSDSIPALLSRGEFVIPAHVVDRWGPGFFERIRTGMLMPAFADGGIATTVVDPGSNSAAPAGPGGRRLTLINTTDPKEALDALDSAAGEDVIYNILRRGRGRFRSVLNIGG
jgi:hypothetical protein